MKSYSQTERFSQFELDLLTDATRVVEAIPDMPGIRCHEVARVVGMVLGLEVVDGRYGAVEHSWLLTGERQGSTWPAMRYLKAHVLDTYAVGRLPQVQLVDLTVVGASPYEFGAQRTDIDDVTIDQVLSVLECCFPAGIRPQASGWPTLTNGRK